MLKHFSLYVSDYAITYSIPLLNNHHHIFKEIWQRPGWRDEMRRFARGGLWWTNNRQDSQRKGKGRESRQASSCDRLMSFTRETRHSDTHTSRLLLMLTNMMPVAKEKITHNISPPQRSPFVSCVRATFASIWSSSLGVRILATATTNILCAFIIVPVYRSREFIMDSDSPSSEIHLQTCTTYNSGVIHSLSH